MGGGLSVPLEIAAALAVLLVVAVLAFTVRRVVLARSRGSFDCSVRADRGSSWSIGVARYGPERVDWFRVFSLSPRPSRSWERSRLEVVGRRVPVGGEALAVLPGVSVISCRYDGHDLDLAMSAEAYTGLASWAESGPPGRFGSVT